MPRPVVAAAVAVATLPVALLVGCSSHHGSSPGQAAAQRFLDALGRDDAAGAAAVTTDQAAAGDLIATSLKGLGNPTGKLRVTSMDGSTAKFSASWSFAGQSAPWAYDGSLQLAKTGDTGDTGDTWRVAWAPSDLNPGLGAGQHLVARRVQPTRADLQDSAGKPLFTPTAVVDVGIEPKLMKDLASLAATLASTLHVDAKDIVNSVKAAPSPDAFVDIITLRTPAYLKVRALIHDLPGTVFKPGTELLAPTSRFAQPLLGHVGPATDEIAKASGGRIQSGDQTGLGGLQQVFDKQLAGTPGIDVYAADADGTPGHKLGTVGAPKPGTPVQLTLDRAVQTAADAALADVTKQAAIVAVQPSTGRILAVANSASTQGDIALAGQYPPGSTSKIVTAAAALGQAGVTPDSQQTCPKAVPAGGVPIHNNGGEEFPSPLTLRKAFAMSCDTTFVQLALKAPAGALNRAATELGIGATWHLPVDSFSGSVPAGPTEGELGQDSIGQGKMLQSPLGAAAVAGAVQSGRPVVPSLVVGQQAKPGPALPAATTTALQELMRSVITDPDGSGHMLADLPGPPVSGKTGTAQYTPDLKHAHAWFAGYRGDIAFGVFVYGGESSKDVGVPITRTFLAGLH